MSQSEHPAQRIFKCNHCQGEIEIPYELPPTTAPCPHCGVSTTSPPMPEADDPAPVMPSSVGSVVGIEPAEGSPAPDPTRASEPAATSPAAAPNDVTLIPEETIEIGSGPVVGDATPADQELVVEEAETVQSTAKDETGGKMSAALIFFLALVLLIAGLVMLGLYLLGADERHPVTNDVSERALVERNRFLREGWKPMATEQLRGFLAAETPEEKAQFVLGGQNKIRDMERFYAEPVLEGRDTPLAAFSHFDLQLSDRERGLFLMRYERPAQFNMREFFRPVAPLEVQYKIAEPGLLLSSFAMLENFATDPVRVMAFFKNEGGKLQLDWDVFVQTKYRTLKDFSSLPQPGVSRTFRVVIDEDLPDSLSAEPGRVRFYRITDPSSPDDHVKEAVPVASEMGRTLEVLNWIGLVVNEKPSRTATVKLEWSMKDNSELILKDLVCWEFLNLGGVPGNATPPAIETGVPAVEEAPVVPVPTGGAAATETP